MSIKSKSKALRGTKDPLFPYATGETVTASVATEKANASASPATPTQDQRIEQMYLLADIFACIFEALPDEYEHAIVTPREAA